MMVAEIETDQFSLFPVASISEINKMRKDLSRYKKAKKTKEDLERHHNREVLNSSDVYCRLIAMVNKIDRAFNLILDEEVKEIIEYRFIQGHDRSDTICNFNLCERSIDRKILEGIESIANTFKLWEELH